MPTEKRDHSLCRTLLDDIQESVVVFKPSKSLVNLSNKETSTKEPEEEVDIVISGGGLKGYYMAGCSHVLLGVFRKQGVRIVRIAGASAGIMSLSVFSD